MRITIHQPSYWPWLGLLDKIAKVEKYIVMDDVAANKASYQYKNQFFCNGQAKNISLPVNYKTGILINELQFKNDNWKQDHLNKIRNYYLKAPFFKEIYPQLEVLYNSYSDEVVFPFILETMKFSFDILNIKVDIVKSSELPSDLYKGDLVLDLCKKASATTYLSGQGAKIYMTKEQLADFKKDNINLEWHYFKHPVYSQHNKFDFISGLACLDLFFWNGKENSREIFWKKL